MRPAKYPANGWPSRANSPMKRPHRSRPLLVALYANAALLLAILICLASRGSSGSFLPSASAAPMMPQPIAGNGNLYLMPAQLLNSVWGCYVMDTEAQTLSVYSYNGNQLRLIAARSIRSDHHLTNYNTAPDPEEIRKLVELETQKLRVAPQANPSGPQEPHKTSE
jgi:hypothetical protein